MTNQRGVSERFHIDRKQKPLQLFCVLAFGRNAGFHFSRKCSKFTGMTTIEDIEKAVAELPPDQLQQFRAWFAEFEAARFDQKIERDAKEGRLDRLAELALAEYRAGRAREL
jgi:hypothetical protein